MRDVKRGSSMDRVISSILWGINSQTSYQGIAFGHGSLWAIVTINDSYGGDVVTAKTLKHRGIDATADEIWEALEILQETKEFSQCIRVEKVDNNTVKLFDWGHGAPNIAFNFT